MALYKIACATAIVRTCARAPYLLALQKGGRSGLILCFCASSVIHEAIHEEMHVACCPQPGKADIQDMGNCYLPLGGLVTHEAMHVAASYLQQGTARIGDMACIAGMPSQATLVSHCHHDGAYCKH